MAYLSKYLPHLNPNDRDAINGSVTNSSWVDVASKSTDGVKGVSSDNAMLPTVPPERPPKKPHLRNISQQVAILRLNMFQQCILHCYIIHLKK